MMPDNLYTITQITAVAPQQYRISVMLAAEHSIYRGHFPGNPVVPGVCSLQMIIESAGKALGYPVIMINMPVVKFLDMIRPAHNKTLEIDLIIDDGLALKGTVSSEERKVLSCRMKLKKNEILEE
jgi:3-hydroxyacyl-[acyl-carrier-protein] dehydratase